MHAEPNRSRWYALQVRTRWERSTANLLSGRGYQIILPTFKTVQQRRGNSKAVVAPLFPGYVFCRFDANFRLPVLITPGVVAVVKRGSIPAAVEDWEMKTIERVVVSGVQSEPCPYLEAGQNVRIREWSVVWTRRNSDHLEGSTQNRSFRFSTSPFRGGRDRQISSLPD